MLRLGIDAAVVPGVELNATDLAGALRELVNCDMVGELVAGKVGIGSPALYQVACETGMVAAASDIYGKIAALDARHSISS